MAHFRIKSESELIKTLEIIDKSYGSEPISIEFETGNYIIDTLNLPRAKHGFVYINGNGSNIKFKKGALGMVSVPKSNSQGLNEFMSTRYLIENFSKIEGGERGIHLGATFNSVIRNVQCVGQTEAGIEIQFGLMTRLENILITNPFKDGIRLGIGDWSGANKRNSQSNHSVLEQCRVYNRAGGRYSYDIQESSGVVIRDCIAEGRENLRAINFSAYGNSVVKNFKIENFHMEYNPKEAGIYISAGARTSNIIDGFFINSNGIKYPIATAYNAPIQIKNIAWWRAEWKIMCTHHAPRILINQCNWLINEGSVMTILDRPLFRSYIKISNQLTS